MCDGEEDEALREIASRLPTVATRRSSSRARAEGGRVEIDGDALRDHQRGSVRLETRGHQSGRETSTSQIVGDETDVAAVDAQLRQSELLIGLGDGLIDLPPVHSLFGEAPGSAVVAGADAHDLRHFPVQGVDHRSVKKGGPTPKVAGHGAREIQRLSAGHVAGQGFVGLRLPVWPPDSSEGQPISGHSLGCHRGANVTHDRLRF